MGAGKYDLLIPGKEKEDFLKWGWGTVQDDMTIVMDIDGSIIPSNDIDSLVQLYPGQRVNLDRYGTSLRATGTLKTPSFFPGGDSADQYISPGTYVVRVGAEATIGNGFPKEDGAGWLEVFGDEIMILQRYTYFSTMEVWQRFMGINLVWSSWRRIDYLEQPKPQLEYPTLINGWSGYSSFGSPRFKVVDDVVTIFGAARYGTPGIDTPLWVMPPHARPSSTRLLLANAGSATHDFRVGADGSVYMNDSSATFNYISFEGISYSIL